MIQELQYPRPLLVWEGTNYTVGPIVKIIIIMKNRRKMGEPKVCFHSSGKDLHKLSSKVSGLPRGSGRILQIYAGTSGYLNFIYVTSLHSLYDRLTLKNTSVKL